MKKIKYILVSLVMIATTLVINGGTRSKSFTGKPAENEQGEKKPSQGFPDLITFTNYINQ